MIDRLYAISDLHLSFPDNRRALGDLRPHAGDWLAIAGDVAERRDQLQAALEILTDRFEQVVWVPGNHDLWTMPDEAQPPVGQAKYEEQVAICRAHGVLTPEDPYPQVQCAGERYVIAPLFLLYDYSLRPTHIPREEAIDWARESGIMCADEQFLHADPYPSKEAWCTARCEYTEQRLGEIDPQHRLILVNHFPLVAELAQPFAIPRFVIWCGTTRTAAWHRRFNVEAVVSGHLHIRRSDVRDGVRFEEVSLGYPRQWNQSYGIEKYLRQILPNPYAQG